MRRNRILAWIPAICYIGMIFALSAQSSFADLPSMLINLPDKLVHTILYMGLALTIFYGASKVPIPGLGSAYVQSFLLTIIYGAFDEYHQSFVSNRTTDIKDWMADICGALIMLFIIYLYIKYRGEGNVRREKL